MTRSRPWSSLAFRLALSYGALMVLTMTIVLSVFYIQTVGVVRVRLDKQAENHVRRLLDHSAKYGPGALESEILLTIRDGVDTDTEILILVPEGNGRTSYLWFHSHGTPTASADTTGSRSASSSTGMRRRSPLGSRPLRGETPGLARTMGS